MKKLNFDLGSIGFDAAPEGRWQRIEDSLLSEDSVIQTYGVNTRSITSLIHPIALTTIAIDVPGWTSAPIVPTEQHDIPSMISLKDIVESLDSKNSGLLSQISAALRCLVTPDLG